LNGIVVTMIIFLLVIAVLVIVFPPLGLVVAGVWLYWRGTKMEKLHEEPITTVQQVRMNEYDYRVLEEMK